MELADLAYQMKKSVSVFKLFINIITYLNVVSCIPIIIHFSR